MNKIKVFVDAIYADRQSSNNRVQKIIDLPENYDLNDIKENIFELRYGEGYTIKEIKVLQSFETIENTSILRSKVIDIFEKIACKYDFEPKILIEFKEKLSNTF